MNLLSIEHLKNRKPHLFLFFLPFHQHSAQSIEFGGRQRIKSTRTNEAAFIVFFQKSLRRVQHSSLHSLQLNWKRRLLKFLRNSLPVLLCACDVHTSTPGRAYSEKCQDKNFRDFCALMDVSCAVDINFCRCLCFPSWLQQRLYMLYADVSLCHSQHGDINLE